MPKMHFYKMALLFIGLHFLSTNIQGRPLRLDDQFNKKTLSDDQTFYYFENHDSEELIPPLELTKKTLSMLTMSRKEQDLLLRKLIPDLLQAPYLNIDHIHKQRFKSQADEPLNKIVAWKYVWYRFEISYDGQKPQKNVVIQPGFNCDYCFLYSTSAESSMKFEGYAGRILPKPPNSGFYTGNFFESHITKGVKKTFFLLARDQYSPIKPQILSQEAFDNETILQMIIEASVLGAGIFALLYYIFLSFYSRDKGYITYTYLILASFIFFITFQSVTKFLDSFAIFVVFPSLTLGIHILVYVSEVNFMLSYLDVDRLPKAYRFGKRVISIGLVLAFIITPLNQLGFISVLWVFLSFILLVLTCCLFSGLLMVYFSYKRERAGYIFTIVGSVVAIAVMVNYAYYFIGWSNEFIAKHYNLVRFSFFAAISTFSLEMGTRLKIANDQLKIYIGKVEDLVAQKTAKISTIMNNIGIGIFAVPDDRALLIDSEYSKELEKIFEVDQIAGESANELFINRLDLSNDQKSQLDSFMRSAIGEDEIMYEMNKHMVLNEVSLKLDHRIKYLEVDWNAVIQDDTVISILVAVKDITEKKELEQQASLAKRELEMIDKILQVKPESFRDFIIQANTFIENNRTLIQKNKDYDPEIVKILFINMHTLKGVSRGYDFHDITGYIHDIEQSYDDIRNGKASWDGTSLVSDLTPLEQLLSEYQEISSSKLGRSFDHKEMRVSVEILTTIFNIIDLPSAKDSSINPAKSYLRNLLYTDIHKVMRECLEPIAILARDLNKLEPRIILEGDDPGVDHEGANVVKHVMTHIIRNSMDHGIETEEERIENGKDGTGTITINTQDTPQHFSIEIYDDGRGLNLAKVKSLGIQRDLISQGDDLPDEQIASLILASGFSTASSVTEVSGRGVGMDAIRKTMEACGGALEIRLGQESPKEGFRAFSLMVSLPSKFLSQSPL